MSERTMIPTETITVARIASRVDRFMVAAPSARLEDELRVTEAGLRALVEQGAELLGLEVSEPTVEEQAVRWLQQTLDADGLPTAWLDEVDPVEAWNEGLLAVGARNEAGMGWVETIDIAGSQERAEEYAAGVIERGGEVVAMYDLRGHERIEPSVSRQVSVIF